MCGAEKCSLIIHAAGNCAAAGKTLSYRRNVVTAIQENFLNELLPDSNGGSRDSEPSG